VIKDCSKGDLADDITKYKKEEPKYLKHVFDLLFIFSLYFFYEIIYFACEIISGLNTLHKGGLI
jgi:hypothetical protein